MSDPNATKVGDVSDEEAGVLDRALGFVRGLWGGDEKAGAKTADTPDAVLKGLLDATDPAANSGATGVEPQPGSSLYEPGILNDQDVSDDVLINSTRPRQGGNGGIIRPGAETNKGRPSPLVDWRDEDMAFSSAINPENTPGKPGWVSPFERRWNAVTRPIRGVMSIPDPNGIKMRDQAVGFGTKTIDAWKADSERRAASPNLWGGAGY